MDNVALFILILVVVVLVIGLVVAAFWNKDCKSGHHKTDPAGGETFEVLYERLGNKLFELTDSINSASQGSIRAEIDVLIARISQVACDPDKVKEFSEAYKSKVDNLVKLNTLAFEEEFNRSFFSDGPGRSSECEEKKAHTQSGTYTGTDRSISVIKSEMRKVKFELNLLSTALAKAYAECASVEVVEMTKLLNISDQALIEYNELKNIEGNKEKAKEFKDKHIRLWQKLHLN